MSLWKIAWRSIQHRALASYLTAFSMSLGVALIVVVIVIYGVLNQSFRRSAQGYDLIVGPKGSSLELVISTVFYQREPIGTIPYEYLLELRSGRYQSVVEAAIPVALGEHYRGLPVVATTSDFFNRLEYMNGRKYTFQAGGSNFSDQNYNDAVVGYAAAKKTGLKVGDTFKTMHGKDATDEHQAEYHVVGILNPTGTPNDGALFINIEGFHDMHAGQETVLDQSLTLKKKPVVIGVSEDPGKTEDNATDDHDHDHDDHDHGHDHSDHAHGDDGHGHSHGKAMSAILVLTKEQLTQVTVSARDQLGRETEVKGVQSTKSAVYDREVMALPERIANDLDAQAVRPTQVVAFLFEKIIGNIQVVLLILATLVIIVAGIGMMVSIYNSMNERRHEIAIMRALGAKRVTVMAVILLESILLSLGGGALGLLIGHSLMFILGPWISSATGIIVSAMHFQITEAILIPGLIILASIVGYLPAVIAYRTDVAQSLSN